LLVKHFDAKKYDDLLMLQFGAIWKNLVGEDGLEMIERAFERADR